MSKVEIGFETIILAREPKLKEQTIKMLLK